jgi:tRNA A-37 threonylcarbamoyl transferase component Bud32
VRGSPYPIVRVDWVNGDTLNLSLDKRSGNPNVMENLRASFRALASTLHRAGIAHGDIQNLNVLVVGTDLRLIDYDGMYVPHCRWAVEQKLVTSISSIPSEARKISDRRWTGSRSL